MLWNTIRDLLPLVADPLHFDLLALSREEQMALKGPGSPETRDFKPAETPAASAERVGWACATRKI